MIEIAAIYVRCFARRDEWKGCRFEPVATIEGFDGEWLQPGDEFPVSLTDDDDSLVERLTYRLYGEWKRHPKFGPQFDAKTWVRAQPHGRAGVVRYLQQAPFVGHRTSEVLWEKFGGDAVRVLRETPEVAAAAAGGSFTPTRAEQAAAWLRDEAQLEGCSIDLMNLLDRRGFPKTTAKKAIQAWGNRAAEWIQRCPYRLMAFRGCGFKKTDAMYMDLGLEPRSLVRQAFAAWYTLASDRDGHTWRPDYVVLNGIRSQVGDTGADAFRAVAMAKRLRGLLPRRDRLGNMWFGEHARARAERSVAESIAELQLAGGDLAWPDVAGLDGLTEHQAAELAAATAGPLGLLTGSPGTGKTYTSGKIAHAIAEAYGDGALAAAAPTGKAAARLSQSLAGAGVPVRARTIHSLLGIGKREDREGWGFDHGKLKPLPFKFLLVDEFSMVDTTLFAALLEAVAVGTHLLLIGDPNQLPPVGHGAPLRDLIAASLPCGRLTEIKRNDGSIVRVCAAIRDNRPWQLDDVVDLPAGKNLKLIPALDDAAAQARLLGAVRVAAAAGHDPIWDVQCVCALNSKGEQSRKALNELLQRELNKTGTKAPDNPFLVGDKVVNTKNGFFKLCDDDDQPTDDEIFAANGELGRVAAVQHNRVVIELGGPGGTRIIVPRGKQKDEDKRDDEDDDEKTSTGCTWDLGYALSVHKSQGSEWPVVIVMVDPGARRVCSREWVYTAISRAKSVCLLIGDEPTLRKYCRRQVLPERRTFLVEQIAEQIELRKVEEIILTGDLDG